MRRLKIPKGGDGGVSPFPQGVGRSLRRARAVVRRYGDNPQLLDIPAGVTLPDGTARLLNTAQRMRLLEIQRTRVHRARALILYWAMIQSAGEP